MTDIDGIETPDMEITEAEFEAVHGLVRLIGGEIVLGKTATELAAETDEKRKNEITAELRDIDVKSGRAARAVALAVSAGQTPVQADVNRLAAFEAAAEALRAELQGL